jgi:acetyl-CoA carboxylase carboxyl transferase subunit beta
LHFLFLRYNVILKGNYFMSVQDWFEKRKEAQIQRRELETKVEIEGNPDLWTKCVLCSAQLLRKDMEETLYVCPQCSYHFRINASQRVNQLFDENSFEELYENVKPSDPLKFTDTEPYTARIKKAHKKTGLNDAVITGTGKIGGYKIAAAIMDFDYMGGSMGSVVGEKVTRIIEKAIELKLPVIAITSSGGARMQESALSLMQMAKTSLAVAKLDEAGLLYINLLTEPTFGGVTASFGMLGDIIIAEQGARIGFAGRRVIEQTIRQKLPPDFQTAEYLLKYGQVDIVSERKDLRKTLTKILEVHKG